MQKRQIRKIIEQHFFHVCGKRERLQQVRMSILDSRQFGFNPTQRTAIRLYELDSQQDKWEKVVSNTFLYFRYKPHYQIMHELYVKRKKRHEIKNKDILWDTTYSRWRIEWLDYAYLWCKEYDLVN